MKYISVLLLFLCSSFAYSADLCMATALNQIDATGLRVNYHVDCGEDGAFATQDAENTVEAYFNMLFSVSQQKYRPIQFDFSVSSRVLLGQDTLQVFPDRKLCVVTLSEDEEPDYVIDCGDHEVSIFEVNQALQQESVSSSYRLNQGEFIRLVSFMNERGFSLFKKFDAVVTPETLSFLFSAEF